MEERLPGAKIVDVTRIGKFVCFELARPSLRPGAESRFYLLVHLGMTGNLTLRAPSEEIAPHTHVFFMLNDGRELRYTDPRRFGRMAILPEGGLAALRDRLGSEPLVISVDEFRERLKSRRARVKALLLNQNVLRGMGNIYADESLFRAGIHPARIAQNLTNYQLAALHRAIREVLRAAIRSRGSSISDYRDADGNRGEFQLRHRVYQKEGKPCVRCGEKIRRVIVAGRSSYFCPRCQPGPRIRAKSDAREKSE